MSSTAPLTYASSTSSTRSQKKRIQPMLVSSIITTSSAAAPAPVELTRLSPDVLTVTLSRDPAHLEHHAFLHTPATECKKFANHTDLQLFLDEMTLTCVATRGQWMRDPTASWVSRLYDELTETQKDTVHRAHRKLNTSTASSIDERWFDRSELSTTIIDQWLEKKTLDEVILKSKEFGHDSLPLGYVVGGDLVNSGTIGMNHNVTFDELHGMLESLNACKNKAAMMHKEEDDQSKEQDEYSNDDSNSATSSSSSSSSSSFTTTSTTSSTTSSTSSTASATGSLFDPNNTVSMYENQPRNSLTSRRQDVIHLNALKERWKRTSRTTTAFQKNNITHPWGSTLDGCGSLNTTFNYGEFDGSAEDLPQVDMLHEYYRSMEELCEGCQESVELNRRLYLLWKFKHYCTPHHQDTHITPHFTLYSQTSGCSVFHFLPVLVGLYVAHQGESIGNSRPHEIKKIMQHLDEMKIGSVATVGPGQMALIMPSGSHGVFVPLVESHQERGSQDRKGQNAELGIQPFDISLIRAAELVVAPLREDLSRMLSAEDGRWKTPLPMTTEEKEMLRKFEAIQTTLCRDEKMTREEWFYCAQKMWGRWEKRGGPS